MRSIRKRWTICTISILLIFYKTKEIARTEGHPEAQPSGDGEQSLSRSMVNSSDKISRKSGSSVFQHSVERWKINSSLVLEIRVTNASASTVLPFRASTLMVPRNLSMATEKDHTAKTPASIPSISNGTRGESATATIKIAVPGTSDITRITPGNHSGLTTAPSISLLTTNSTHSLGSGGPSTAAVSTTGTNITIPEATQDSGRRPLTFWAIILICLTVSGFFIGGYVGCCFLWKKNIF